MCWPNRQNTAAVKATSMLNGRCISLLQVYGSDLFR
jgi:hypothetical protein